MKRACYCICYQTAHERVFTLAIFGAAFVTIPIALALFLPKVHIKYMPFPWTWVSGNLQHFEQFRLGTTWRREKLLWKLHQKLLVWTGLKKQSSSFQICSIAENKWSNVHFSRIFSLFCFCIQLHHSTSVWRYKITGLSGNKQIFLYTVIWTDYSYHTLILLKRLYVFKVLSIK